MAESVKRPKALFQKIAAESDSTANSTELIEKAKQEALTRWSASRRAPQLAPRRRQRVFALGFALAAMLSIVLYFNLSVKALGFTVGGETGQRPLGTWIAAGQEPIDIRFSEGTVITLDREARARITRADVKGAHLLLERGLFTARVVHLDPPVPWTLYAGPYEIHVTGTQFDVMWDPAQDVLDLRMTEGRVIVRGPLLEDGKTISKGEHLQIGLQQRSLTISAFSPDDPPRDLNAINPANSVNLVDNPNQVEAPAQPKVPEVNSAEPAAPAHPASTSSNSMELEPSEPSWQSLAASGNYRAALSAAEKRGFDEVIRHAAPAELLILADSARFAGDFNKAKEVLIAARKRGVKNRTAFLLGKIAADHQASPGEAIVWFETYLAEQPNGSLSEQALGRLIELSRKSGDMAGAQKHAALYVKRYPGGAFIALANSVLGP